MKRVFSDPGAVAAETLEEVERRMRGLGAEARECRAMCRAVELFLEWCGHHKVNGDREAGIAWLRERRGGMEVQAYQEMKAGLATWIHLTGQARSEEQAQTVIMVGPVAELSQGGRVSGVAVSGQRSAVSGQRSAVSGQRSAVSGRRSAVGGRRSAVGGQWAVDSGRLSM